MTSFRVHATPGRPPFFINRTQVGLTPAGARLAEVHHARIDAADIIRDATDINAEFVRVILCESNENANENDGNSWYLDQDGTKAYSPCLRRYML